MQEALVALSSASRATEESDALRAPSKVDASLGVLLEPPQPNATIKNA
jgi:hypothetical protein